MGPELQRTAWYYDKNVSIVTMFNMAMTRLEDLPDAIELLSLFSCYGPHMIAVDLLSGFWKSKIVMEDGVHLDNSNSSKKIQWLKTIGQDLITFGRAISRLENLCLITTRRDDDGVVTSTSVHSTICKWRLETINERDREDWIMLAALVLSQNLPDIGVDAVPHLKFIPLIKNSLDLMQQYIEPRNVEPPNGRVCHRYAAISARYAQVYAHSPYTKEAETMIHSIANYESLRQGPSWPQDRRSLLILKHLALSFSKSRKFDKTIEILEFLCNESTRLFGEMDDIPVWAAARLHDVRHRKVLHDQSQQQVMIATSGTKTSLRLDRISYCEDFPATPEDLANPTSDEEYRLIQMVQESKEQFGLSDDDTLIAMSDLARFYKESGLYFKAGIIYERLWNSLPSVSTKTMSTHPRQVLADAVDCYIKSDGLGEQIGRGSFKEGLIWATLYGDEKALMNLITAGAKVNSSDGSGYTALHYAVLNRFEAIIHHLLKANADTSICTRKGYTPLHMAFSNQYTVVSTEIQRQVVRVAAMLVEGGANIHAVTYDGVSVLRAAAQGGVKAYVQFMIDNGVRSDESDAKGGTALQVASMRGFEDIVELLRESGIYSAREKRRSRRSFGRNVTRMIL